MCLKQDSPAGQLWSTQLQAVSFFLLLVKQCSGRVFAKIDKRKLQKGLNACSVRLHESSRPSTCERALISWHPQI